MARRVTPHGFLTADDIHGLVDVRVGDRMSVSFNEDGRLKDAVLDDATDTVVTAANAAVDLAVGGIPGMVPPLVYDALASDDAPAQAAALAAEAAVDAEIAGRSLLEAPAIIKPVLVLSPDGSANQSGAVTPTQVGTVNVVSGQYGSAWSYLTSDGRMEVANTGYISPTAGTVIIRALFDAPLPSGSSFILGTSTEGFRLSVWRASNGRLFLSLGNPPGSNAITANGVAPDDTFLTVAVTWGDGNATLYVNGTEVVSRSYTPDPTPPTTIRTSATSSGHPFQTESHLFYTKKLSQAEIARISAIAAPHTIATTANEGVATIPASTTRLVGPHGVGATELELMAADDTPVTLAVTSAGVLTANGIAVGSDLNPPLTVTKTGDTHTITTMLASAPLVIQTLAHNGGNGVFNFVNTDYNGTRIHNIGDDATPVRFTSAVGGNHGYTRMIAYTVAGHGKTAADLGSIYTDGTNQYTLLAISGDSLTFGYPYTVDGSGVTIPDTVAPADTLTHVSGGANTGNVPITTVDTSIGQLWPSTTAPDVRYVLDGKEITANGTYGGRVLRVVETYTILDYKGIIDWAQTNIGQSFAANRDAITGALRVSNTFTFREGGRCTLSTNLTALRPVTLGNTGIIQSFKLDETTYKLWRYMPGVVSKGGYDFNTPVDMTSYATSLTYGPADYLDPTQPPSRYVDWLQSGSTKIVGFTAGYITDKTNTKNSDRVGPGTWWDMRGTKKIYPVAITGVTLSPGDHRSFEAFRNYVAPHPSGATLVNVVEDAQATYVHLDFHNSVTAEPIPLPDHIGKSVTVLQSTGLTVANDTVDAAGLTVTVPGTSGRAVVKLT